MGEWGRPAEFTRSSATLPQGGVDQPEFRCGQRENCRRLVRRRQPVALRGAEANPPALFLNLATRGGFGVRFPPDLPGSVTVAQQVLVLFV
jgi:hypothetical protein